MLIYEKHKKTKNEKKNTTEIFIKIIKFLSKKKKNLKKKEKKKTFSNKRISKIKEQCFLKIKNLKNKKVNFKKTNKNIPKNNLKIKMIKKIFKIS
ncbi:MAG TPA: hypothetical protein VFP07_01575 [Buchnera sp. (in: enterobacteria)]|nr:hypothetical protein [Buchnera sp. (in: enterobacteria)]